jgi:hypothetical protein
MSKAFSSQAWLYMLVTSAFGRLRQEDLKFKVSLSYRERPVSKKS